ncbi:hypothetical protein P3W45_001748 [Vairimorpha bombi]|jgi:predicted ribosome quality control (RQC) complex YloA/Tae2 family protein
MKQRFTFLDIRAVINELKPRLVNKFIQNFYTTHQRIIYIKFSSKDILLIEPGIRIHLTSHADNGISHFCNILRKRARRDKVADIYQIGFDRVIVFELSRQKIVVEFFSGGNVFILDDSDKIVEVFRVVKELDIVKNTQYVFNPVTFDFTWKSFCEMDLCEFLPFEKDLVDSLIKKLNKECGCDIMEYKKKSDVPPFIESFDKCMREFSEYINDIKDYGCLQMKKGKYINIVPFEIQSDNKKVCTQSDNKKVCTESDNKKVCTESDNKKVCTESDTQKVCTQSDNKKVFRSFNEAAEEYFTDRKKIKKEPVDKIQKVKDKQYEHIKELENMIEEMSMKAELIMKNNDLVENIRSIHKSVKNNKIKWDDFNKFKEDENKKGNRASLSIIKSDFKDNTCIVNLSDKDTSCYVCIDFDKSVHLNIQNYYERRKKLVDKIEKTKHAIDNVKIKVYKKEEKIKLQRPVFWFEKFNFCFTTDKKLIIGGKNSQQNEILVKKHLTPSQLYFHTESSGGSSVVADEDVCIEEAALVALCNSACWDCNVVSPVFYVKGEQVSKSPPTGQYLNKGSFIIRGTKTYVNVYKLEYGVGLLFKTIDDIQEGDYFIKYEDAVFVTDPKDYEIEYAVPVSAPYKILKDLYKFRVRILPGKDKKGKVVQSIVNTFTKDTDERIIKIIKRISVEEFINVLPTNIKIGKDIK